MLINLKKIKINSKIILLLSVILATVLYLSDLSASFSQTSIIYVSSAGLYRRITPAQKNNQTVWAYEGLTIGEEWAVFSLKHKNYWGNATVVERYRHVPDPAWGTACNNKEESKLILSRRYNSNSEDKDLVLVRPIPKNPSSVKINQVSFSQLPTSVQRQLLKIAQSFLFGRTTNAQIEAVKRGQLYTIDLDLNNSPDIIVAFNVSIFPNYYYGILVISDSNWIIRHEYRCEASTR